MQAPLPKHRLRAIIPRLGIENESTDDQPRGIDLNDIQGDVYPSFSKDLERFIFFTISDPTAFREALGKLKLKITTSQDLVKKLREIDQHRLKFADAPPEVKRQNYLQVEQINISFSGLGFKALGYNPANTGDEFFATGMGPQAINYLGDHQKGPGEVDWDDLFKQPIHGLIIIGVKGHDPTPLEATTKDVLDILGNTIEQFWMDGRDRATKEHPEFKGHEHFGWKDGISQPALRGLSEVLPGQLQCDPGVIIMGHAGDGQLKERPNWTKNCSLMAFRKLRQYVPEFQKFVREHPADKKTWQVEGSPDLTTDEQVALTCARLFGRWQSGAPLDLTEFRDNPAMGANRYRNNNFDYSAPDTDTPHAVPGQLRCPFAAHIRKVAPRKGTSLDLGDTWGDNQQVLERSMIVRTGIPYGEDVTESEKAQDKTTVDRGLAFVCYQSNLRLGFTFLQHAWANNPEFPPQYKRFKKPKTQNASDQAEEIPPPGFDPIIGADNGKKREMTGLFINHLEEPVDMETDFVVGRGGEYFFVPSITVLGMIAENQDLPASSPAVPFP